jgi:hypothetical protein
MTPDLMNVWPQFLIGASLLIAFAILMGDTMKPR